MLVAFQGFPAPPGGKKTGAVMENVFVLGYMFMAEYIAIGKHICNIRIIP
jgi:hypothetical protein